MKGKLDIASAGDAELTYDVERSRAEHLIFLVRERLGRRHDNGIAGVNTDRIDVFHVADGDAVAGRVAHDLVFDLFPAGDRALNKDLSHTGKPETILQNLSEFHHVVRDAAAGTAKRIGRTEHDRVADLLGELHAVLNIFDDLRGSDRLADLLHRLLEHKAVLRLLDREGRRSEELYMMALKESGFCKLHAEIKTRLAAHVGKQTVRLLLLDDLLKNLRGQRFDINLIRDILVRHDCRRIRVHETDLTALFLERAAGLCAGIVELSCLPDDDRPRADDHYLMYIWILWH